MKSIRAVIRKENYSTEVTNAHHRLLADEPKENGGQDLGFSPTELLASSLASCSCITMRMYANRKGWTVDEIDITVTIDHSNEEFPITKSIKLSGALETDQIARLIQIAGLCPVHKLLSKGNGINTIQV